MTGTDDRHEAAVAHWLARGIAMTFNAIRVHGDDIRRSRRNWDRRHGSG
jgi:hypothetical protein